MAGSTGSRLFPAMIVVLLLISLSTVAGEGSDINTDENSLFGSSSADTETGKTNDSSDDLFGSTTETSGGLVEEVTQTSGIESALLVADRVEIGGRYTLQAVGSWNWDDPSTLLENAVSPDSDTATIDLASTLFFDARPKSDFRVFGKATLTYPFDSRNSTRAFDEVVHIDELFSDFNWNEKLFFRGGKHTINWGVGYFFSPADLLNLTKIDPADPEAEREGPLSLKTQLPLNSHNLYLYFIANNVESWDEVGVAAKAELVFGSVEVGVGGLYRKDLAPSAMLTISAPLPGPLSDIDIFGETVLRYGSDKTFVEESSTSPAGVEAVTYNDTFFPSATAGFSYSHSFAGVTSSVGVTGQYLFNGEGYEDPAVLHDNPTGIGALLGAGSITPSDLLSPGRHYAAGNLRWSKLFGSDVSLQLFWIHNFSDGSGYLNPSLSLKMFNDMNLSLQTPYHYGESGDEYTPKGESASLRVSLSMGGGSF